ncbi:MULTISPECIES: trypsin-like peptidase domain-containing protein [Aphanothece]|uniref:trypsin-like peptidase domain-containing protein n=1 Tax=Aphanothece TaxID=1121 RepID=UPI003984EA35
MAPPLTAEQIYRLRADAVVAIDVPDGRGAGLLLSRSGLIVTNHHLVEGWSTALVRFVDGSGHRTPVVRAFRDADLAFLQLEPPALAAALQRVRGGLIADHPPAARPPRVGEEVIAIGHPHGLEYSLTRGVVSGLDRRIDGQAYLQIDAAINPGNSGGPIYNASGELVGLSTCSRVESEGINFAIPAAVIYAKFAQVRQELGAGERRYCSVCGAASADLHYCDQCGALLALVDAVEVDSVKVDGVDPASGGRAVDAPHPAPAGPRPDPAPEPGSGPVPCPVCGRENPPGSPYCSTCGSAL